MQSRRQVLASAAAAVGTALQPWGAGARAASEMIAKRPIPSSGEQIPVVGVGTSGSYDVADGSPEYARLIDVLKVFYELGGALIDTSPNYDRSDAVVGSLLAEGGWRAKTFLATKIAADSRAAAERQWAGSLQKLKTDKVELLQVHNLRAWKMALPYARELKEQGKTKYVGVTHYLASGLPELEAIMRAERLDFIQINYSVNAPQAAERVLPLAKDKGIAVLINRAFDDGRLFAKVKDRPLPGWAGELGITSWAQLFLKFALANPAVTCVIPATGRPDRQADNMRAGLGGLPSEAQQKEMIAAFA
jgi:aryl-alcohol dehydrogenase-like predicted oxidoreductase